MTKFSLKKKLLPSLMAASLASGVAFSGNANAIHLAEDGVGQALLAPMYLADYGYTTKIAIVNHSTEKAVKAKVVLRSAVTSTELLDFILYLSPGDVWRGEIRQQDLDKDGTTETVLYSADDSIKNDQVPAGSGVPVNADGTTFGSILPVTQKIFIQNVGNGDTEKMGHIEIIGLYAVDGDINVPGSAIPISQGMSKFALAKIFDTPRVTGLDPINTPTETTDPTTSKIRSADPDWVHLSGTIEMMNANDRMGYRIPALVGATGDNIPSSLPTGLPTSAAPFDGKVIANTAFDANAAAGVAETALGFGWGQLGTDKIIEVEMALASSMLTGTYEDDTHTTPTPGINRTRMMITFPTRYRHGEAADPDGNIVPNNPCGVTGLVGADHFSSPFKTNGSIEYALAAFNNFEVSSAASGSIFSGGPVAGLNKLVEVNYFIPSWPATKKQNDNLTLVVGTHNFESGWFQMSFSVREGCPYAGAPVLSFIHKHKEKAVGQFMNSWLVPASHN